MNLYNEVININGYASKYTKENTTRSNKLVLLNPFSFVLESASKVKERLNISIAVPKNISTFGVRLISLKARTVV